MDNQLLKQMMCRSLLYFSVNGMIVLAYKYGFNTQYVYILKTVLLAYLTKLPTLPIIFS